MKKIIVAVAVLGCLSVFTTSCGGSQKGEVDNDTVFTKQFTDSMSMALGAFMGANLQDEVRYSDNISDYIEGYQLVAGNKFSYEKLKGIHAGLFAAEQFSNMELQGVPVNRDLFMQEFRKYLQSLDLDQTEYAILYRNFQEMLQKIDQTLIKRQQMRNGVAVVEDGQAEQVEVVDETVELDDSTPADADANASSADLTIDEEFEQISL